jgi:hypothetical protein
MAGQKNAFIAVLGRKTCSKKNQSRHQDEVILLPALKNRQFWENGKYFN